MTRAKAAGILATFATVAIVCGRVADADVVVDHGSFVSSLNAIGGAMNLSAGTGVSVTPNSATKSITIASTQSLNSVTGAVTIGEAINGGLSTVTGIGSPNIQLSIDMSGSAEGYTLTDSSGVPVWELAQARVMPDTLELAASSRWFAYDGASPDESLDITYDTFSYGPLMSPGSDAGGVLLTMFPLTDDITDTYTSVSVVWSIGCTTASDSAQTFRIKANSFDVGTAQVEANYTTVGFTANPPAAAYAFQEIRTEFDALISAGDDYIALQFYNVALGNVPVFAPVSLKFHN